MTNAQIARLADALSRDRCYNATGAFTRTDMLYRRWGLESAMLAHFLVDLAVYVVLVPSVQSQNTLWVLVALASVVAALV